MDKHNKTMRELEKNKSGERSAVGIVAVKKHSVRFPGKNLYEIDGKPMFMHAVDAIAEAGLPVILATDSVEAMEIYSKKYSYILIHRERNVNRDNEPLMSVIKFTYQCLPAPDNHIVVIMANCPGHTPEKVNEALNLCIEKDLNEVRSYNAEGEESGLMVFKEEVVLSGRPSGVYTGAIFSDVKEIHYKEDLNGM